jgi:hypothetical protein
VKLPNWGLLSTVATPAQTLQAKPCCVHIPCSPSHPTTCHPAVVTGIYARMQSQKVQHSEMSDDEILASNDDEEVHRVADSMQHTV